MDLITKYEISLDLIRNNYVAIRIKQYDKNSRKVIIHCTANGQEYQLDKTVKALIQVRKSDGHVVEDECEINLEDNTLIATVSQQMSTAAGVCLADVSLFNIENDQVLGTMKFNIVTDSNAITKEDIVSSSEFNTLADLVIIGKEKIEKIIALTTQIETQEEERQSNEETRKGNEETRISNENERKANETKRQQAESSRVEVEEARVQAESARVEVEKSRVQAEASRVQAENSRVQVENSRVEAEASRVQAENARVQAENSRVTAEGKRQTDTAAAIKGCNDIQNEVEEKLANGDFNGRTVLTGSGDPSPELGKDGDIYIDVAGIEPHAHYLFTKADGTWTPQWCMRGLNGKVVDSLADDSIANAPSVRAVKEGIANVTIDSLDGNSTTNSPSVRAVKDGIAKKVVDNLTGQNTDAAPSVRAVKEGLNGKADNIMILLKDGSEFRSAKLGIARLDDSNANNIQLTDRNDSRKFYPVTQWDLVNNKPQLATLVGGKVPLANIPYNTTDFKDVGGNLSVNTPVQNLTFELWGVSKKVNYTSEYEVGRYVKIGNLVFFTMEWKGSIKEAGEYARIKMNVLDSFPPVVETAVTIVQWTFSISSSPVVITASVIPAPNSRIVIAHTNGGPAAIWGTGTGQYVKISGCYVTA